MGYYDFGSLNDYLEWEVTVPSPKLYPISFRYQLSSLSWNRPLQLWVNDQLENAKLDFPHTDGSNYWRYTEIVDVPLTSGVNKIKILVADQNGGPNIDHLIVGKFPAVIIKLNNQIRAIAKNGVRIIDDWLYDITDDSSFIMADEPYPILGDFDKYPYGRLQIMAPMPDGSIDDKHLDIGNPIIDFTGYESYLQDYFTFDGSEFWDETASDLYPPGAMRRGQEFLLRNGLDNNLCDMFPDFASEGDVPIFGKLPDGTWLQWTPKVMMESNGPSINAAPEEMTAHVLSDGGGEWSTKTGGKLKCSNVVRSFVNDQTCFLSTDTTACPSSEVADAVGGEENVNGPILVCGSLGEVANDPALPEVFGIETEEETPIDIDVIENQKQVVWTEIALYGVDQLRQRMAWALAQMLTTVPSNIDARDQTEVHVNYYDIMVRNAFGNFRDILREISYSPLMAEHLTYFKSKSHAFVYEDEDKRISAADENYAREIMQLFSIGLIMLNDDGTPAIDPETGNQLETYTNDDIESLARAWTGFDRLDLRGNYEEPSSWSGNNRLDPMKIVPEWRDPFPKSHLNGGFIGDTYPLCVDIPARSFLKKGARWLLLGGNPLPELARDPEQFADDALNITRVELNTSSVLYQRLHNGGNYELTVELDNDLECHEGIECDVDTLRVVKIGPVYYEFVERPCVQLPFYTNGKQIQLWANSNRGQMCANPNLSHAKEACCRGYRYGDVRGATLETGVTHLYSGERMTYASAKDRCVDYGKDLCLFEHANVSPGDNEDWRKGYHWTNKKCGINIKVNPDGTIAIVHDATSTYTDTIPYHVEEGNTLNWFRVFWNGNGDYPGSSEINTCAANNCKLMDDGSCLCKTTVAESVVFNGEANAISKEDVVSQLFIGALGPLEGSTAIDVGDGFTVHTVGGSVNGDTIFEVTEKGKTFYLKNVLSTVVLEGWTMLPRSIYEAEEATISHATLKSPQLTATGDSYVELGTDSSSYIEWNINAPSAGKYLISFRYALDKHPVPLSISVNGDSIILQPATTNITFAYHGSSPAQEHFPLQKCEGDCDSDDQCDEGLFCMQNNALEPVPGCIGSQNSGGDYCAAVEDSTLPMFLPTGGWERDWFYSEPLEVDLVGGSNTIRVQIPEGFTRGGPNLDHLRIEGVPTSTPSSFRNPPHFMSLIPDYGTREVGEQTMRDAQYETEAVLDHYFFHDNVAPFLCTRIMQRFSFSNPSPRFVRTCVEAFRSGSYTAGSVSFGNNEYGSLEALAASVLLDREATDFAAASDPSHGSMKESLLKVTQVMRSLNYQTNIPVSVEGYEMQETFNVKLWEIDEKIGHGPYDFPSVFSFFLPEYIPDSGPAQPASLVSPETMLVTMPNILNLMNGLLSIIKYGLSNCNDGFSVDPGYGSCNDDGQYKRSFGHLFYEPPTGPLSEQVEDLSLLLTAGRLSDSHINRIAEACTSQPDQTSQVRCMEQLIVSTAEFHTTNSVTESGEGRADESTVATTSTEPYKALVYFYLGGGLDSFNLLAPHTCAPVDVYQRYRAIRGKTDIAEGIGLSLERLLDIDANNPSQPCQKFGIHEGLPVLKQLYEEENRLIFIANAGLIPMPMNVSNYKEKSAQVRLYSHNGMRLETDREDVFDELAGTGVGGRIADVLSQAGLPTNTFSIDGQQILLSGEGGQGPSQFVLDDEGLAAFNEDPSFEDMADVMKALNNATAPESGYFAETWSSKLTEIFVKQSSLKTELDTTMVNTELWPEPESGLADEFKIVTRIMQTAQARGVKRDIFYVSNGGFDTHRNVDETLIANFGKMNSALQGFVNELKALDFWESTVLVQFSEFGRTLDPNTNFGSDHAWGGNHFMFGGAVSGGKVLGQYPEDFEPGDEDGIALRRGRMIPTSPWDSMWFGVAEWFGVPATGAGMDKVLPMHKNFPSDKLYSKDQLFDILGSTGEKTTT